MEENNRTAKRQALCLRIDFPLMFVLLISCQMDLGAAFLFPQNTDTASLAHQTIQQQQSHHASFSTTRLSASVAGPRDALVTEKKKEQVASIATECFSTLLDGPCWKSLQKALPNIGRPYQDVGHLQVVTGTSVKDKSNVVGMMYTPSSSQSQDKKKQTAKIAQNDTDASTIVELVSGETLWAHSVAQIPEKVTPAQAALTYAQTLTHLYPLLGRVERVGGDASTNLTVLPKHVVVVGGSADAVLATHGLQALGVDRVTVVSTQTPQIKPLRSSATKVLVTKADADTAFCEKLQSFDAVLDTVGDELEDSYSEGTVIRLLRQRHKCNTYVTTYTKAQQMIGQEGLLFGPGKVKRYQSEVTSPKSIPAAMAAPDDLGSTVQTLLDAGVVWTKDVPRPKEVAVRGWEMGRFMEQTVWPTDSRGSSNTRYGFPVLLTEEDEEEDEDTIMITEAPMPKGMLVEEDVALDTSGSAAKEEKYIRSVVGYRGLQQLERQKLDCVLFLSARWCRTCKKMQLPYRKMAKSHFIDDEESDFVFAKGEASGREGKMLGRALDVQSVPTFVLFRKGKQFGKPISVNRLPSNKLETAIKLLQDGKEWDEKAFDGDNDDDDKQTKL